MRIAYVSHVDSRWIKQRPHFIAESMKQMGKPVTYVCSNLVRKSFLVKSQNLSVPVFRIPMLPQRFRSRLRLLDPLLSAVSALAILICLRPQVVLVTHARHYRLARFLQRAKVRVFYDCMDLNALFSDATSTDAQDESILVDVSERVFCSSDQIAMHIKNVSPKAKVEIVPNALNEAAFINAGGQNPAFTPNIVGYVGAVSSWFDFTAVLALLDARPDVTVCLWGPCDVAIPEHERLKYGGILPHDAAIVAMRSCDILLLPFQITDLIRAVDPVKVYEYIATGRPVVASDYPQLAHFGESINRYESGDALIEQVGFLLNKPTLRADQLTDFISANNWMVRAEKMIKIIG